MTACFRIGFVALLALGSASMACTASNSSEKSDDEPAHTVGGEGGGSNAAGGSEGGQSGQDESPQNDAAVSRDDAHDAASETMPANTDPYASCIMPLGDSITQADLERMSYRYWLWQRLSAEGHKFGFVGSRKLRHRRTANQPTVAHPDAAFDVDHEGHWGKKPSEILALLNGVADWNKQIPGIVLLHAGTNEVWSAGFESAQAIATRATTDVEKLIALLRTKNAEVVVLLATVIPLRKSNYGGNFQAAISALNEGLAALVGKLNSEKSPVVLVDQNSGFDDEHFLSDGVHPNEAGEKRIAARWYAALQPWLQRASGLACPL